MSLEGRSFVQLLEQQVTKDLVLLPNFVATWGSSKAWTSFMLGSSETRREKKDFGVLGRMATSLGYEVRAEYLRVDQVWYSHPVDRKNDWQIDLYLEHENNPARLEETIRKCLQLGGSTKVVITYPEKKPEEQLRERTRKLLRDRYGVSPDARLLLVLGYRDQNSVQWKRCEFDGLGREVGD